MNNDKFCHNDATNPAPKRISRRNKKSEESEDLPPKHEKPELKRQKAVYIPVDKAEYEQKVKVEDVDVKDKKDDQKPVKNWKGFVSQLKRKIPKVGSDAYVALKSQYQKWLSQ